ncbi:hypothetical protein IK7_02425 [Bacillus cereus VD156]|nr:hypothetical protein IK7_02425 [Bacillus cereus VD156]
MTFYWAMNINPRNVYETNELVQTRKFLDSICYEV